MRTSAIATLLMALACAPGARAGIGARRDASRPVESKRTPSSAAALSDLPAHFEPNLGQTDPAVSFLARPKGYRAFFADREAVFVLPRGSGVAKDPRDRSIATPPENDVVRMRFEGARPSVPVRGAGLPGRSSYFLGSDPAKWTRDVPHFADFAAPGLYEGVDLRWRGIAGGRIEYDLELAPGSDPSAIALRFEGARTVTVDAAGRLLVATEGGVLRHGRPAAWQESAGRRLPVSARFAVEDGGRVRFAVGSLDPTLPLVIDPEIDYSTFLGGSTVETIFALGTDAADSVIVGGNVYSADFPVPGGVQTTRSGNMDAFVTKFNPAGTSLAWSTFLGGSADDYTFALAVGADGSVFAAGQTTSSNFPTASALDSSPGGTSDGFLAKINSTGSTLVFSTYVGGSSDDLAKGVAVASDGSAVVSGTTFSSNFPTTSNAFRKTFAGGGQDAFVLRLNPAGSALAWSTFLGGSSVEEGSGLALDASNRPVVIGFTYSTDYPQVTPAQPSNGGAGEAFITKVAADGASLAWSTFFGGSGEERANGVSVAPDGRTWVTGYTESNNLPVVGAAQATISGAYDAFVTRLSADGDAFQMTTYLGGTGGEAAYGIFVDRDDSAFVAGITDSSNFPLQDAIQAYGGGSYDGFVTQFKPATAAPAFSTCIGGNGDDRAYAIAVDSKARVAIGGTSSSPGLNTYPRLNPYDNTLGGTQDGVVTVIKRAPYAPAGLTAALAGLTEIELLWTDLAFGETGFEIERATNGIDFGLLATVPANTVQYLDEGLTPSTTYTYRIRTVAGVLKSDPSGEASASTPATPTSPPQAPANLVATIVSPRRVDFTWQDNSDDEGYFVLARAAGADLYATLATPRINSTAASDVSVLPGRTYTYRVRAVNPTGPSNDSNTQTVTLPSTLEVSLAKAKVKDAASFGKDSLSLAGTFTFGQEAGNGMFDPSLQPLSIRLGSIDGPGLVSIIAGDPAWTLKKGKWTWKSPKGTSAKARVTVVPSTGEWTLSLAKTTLPVLLPETVRVTLTSGTDEGHHDAAWTIATKGGVRKFPVPEPK